MILYENYVVPDWLPGAIERAQQDRVVVPSWMTPSSPDFMYNFWNETSRKLPSWVRVELNNGAVHPTENGVELDLWLGQFGGRIAG